MSIDTALALVPIETNNWLEYKLYYNYHSILLLALVRRHTCRDTALALA